MPNIGSAYVQIIPSTRGIGASLSQALGGPSIKAGKESGNSIASGIKGMLAKAAIGAVVAKGLKSALDAGANLEQSFGGLDTIYGAVSNTMQSFAMKAASAGISANNYAEQAVSMGAALKQAFGGDVYQSMKAADTAIMDMADNAAKMGTPIESVQQAYMGFAKGQYQLLDNLKLGYGGTKGEMERLLKDAQAISGVEYNMDNLGDVYSAIHVIQGELGLTGVAADEAKTTFSGSFGAMKASAENFAATLTTGGNVQAALVSLISSIGTFVGGNLLPMLGNVFSALPGALSTAFTTALPIIQTQGPALVSRIVAGITTALPQVVAKGRELLTMLGNGITANLPAILEKGRSIIIGLFTGLRNALPEIATVAVQIIEGLSSFLETNIPVIAEKGGKMLTALAANIIASIPEILSAIGRIVLAIGNAYTKLRPIAIRAAVQMMTALMNGIETGVNSAVSKAKAAATKIVDGIKEKLKPVADKGKEAMSKLKDKMVSVWDQIYTKAKSAFEKVKSAISKPIEQAKSTVQSAINTIQGLFPISIGNIFSNLRLPHFSVSGGVAPFGIGGKGSLPSFNVSWYKKAMDDPYMFNRASLIGVGEAGDEMLYGKQNLMHDIREAVGNQQGTTNNFYITVDGAENPEEWAGRMVRELQMRMRTA